MASTPQKIQTLQRKLYLKSKQEVQFKFYSLYDKIYRPDILRHAFRLSKANGGAPGIDGRNYESIEAAGLDIFIQKLSDELRTKEYKPDPIRRVLIPKDNGKLRPLGISTIRDRVVQTACKIIAEPIFEPHLHEGSYGYRPKRRAQQAIKEIENNLKAGFSHVYDGDLSAYFDSIPHQQLMKKVQKRISDSDFLALIYRFMRCPIVEEANGKQTYLPGAIQGTPQGNCLSPLLANIYLNDFCIKIATKTSCKIITFADDFVILKRNSFTSEQQEWLADQLHQEGLRLNPDKTRIVDMSKLSSQFDFLGFTFKRVRGFNNNSIYVKIQPSAKSQSKLKLRISQIVKHRTSLDLHQLIHKINPILRGWHNYFKEVGYPRKVFFKMDWYVVRRFYNWSTKRSQRGSKYLMQDAWEKLKRANLFVLQPCRPSKL